MTTRATTRARHRIGDDRRLRRLDVLADQLADPARRDLLLTLGGMAAGLVLAGRLTRDMDEPKLAVTRTMTKVTTASGSTTAFGIAGAF